MLRRAHCLSLLMSTAAVAPISYKLQNINLAERWLGLVRAGVSATTEHGEAYGVAEVAGDLRFFVRGATEKAQKINATLAASGDVARTCHTSFVSRKIKPSLPLAGASTANSSFSMHASVAALATHADALARDGNADLAARLVGARRRRAAESSVETNQ